MADIDQGAMFARIVKRNPFRTEAELAEKLGMSPNTWTAYKRGRQSLKLTQIAEICDIVGVDVEWLLFERDPETPSEVMLAGMAKDAMVMRRTLGPTQDDETGAANDDSAVTSGGGIDPGFFRSIKKLVARVHADHGIKLREDDLDDMAIGYCNEYIISDPEKVWLQWLEERLTHEVLAASHAPGTGKHSAS